MRVETSLKFLIPNILCQQDFAVLDLYADTAKAKILNCKWTVNKYDCDNAPGYTHTIENDHALITVLPGFKEKADDFICEVLGQPKTDPSMCLCKTAGTIGSHINISATSTNATTRGEPDSVDYMALYVGVGAFVFALVAVLLIVWYKKGSGYKIVTRGQFLRLQCLGAHSNHHQTADFDATGENSVESAHLSTQPLPDTNEYIPPLSEGGLPNKVRRKKEPSRTV
ncbi:uncharacterized protein LOC112568453 [Pomacea canaliculata]|uniref:uncharacterized protein LOC112568453 n=1 Tax=Pomacea canaliculata TaxID=400727 RepID=UPI000D73F0E8|nr:uncharacterized protein LOC112568453 [Pomacea canaliculata]